MTNLLLEDVKYKVVETPQGTWRRYMYPQGAVFAEYTSKRKILGLPLVHYTSGLSPETGSPKVARGIFALGRRAVGVIALGRFASGVVSLGQLSLGLVSLGQFSGGVAAVGQIALGGVLGVGQAATGYVSIAQVGLGAWVLAQAGLGRHVWSMRSRDPEALEFFKSLAESLGF